MVLGLRDLVGSGWDKLENGQSFRLKVLRRRMRFLGFDELVKEAEFVELSAVNLVLHRVVVDICSFLALFLILFLIWHIFSLVQHNYRVVWITVIRVVFVCYL